MSCKHGNWPDCDECEEINALCREISEQQAEIERLTVERDKWEEDARTRAQNADFWRGRCDAARVERDALKVDNERLRDALISIEEYWNGDANERAMSDALDYIVVTARAAQEGK